MKLILIRHGEPDYSIDSLTEKGWKEADLLSERISKLSVSAFYCSPLGRAKDTAKATLQTLHAEAEILPWLREFNAPVDNGANETKTIPWDFMPGYWTNQKELYDKDLWFDNERMKTGPVKEEYEKVAAGLDELLKRHGYHREGGMYRAIPGSDDTIVLFCHFGVTCVMLSHLLGIPAPLLWHGFFLAPSSVTILETEERIEGEAYFRCKGMGDTAHLYVNGEPASNAGFFQDKQIRKSLMHINKKYDIIGKSNKRRRLYVCRRKAESNCSSCQQKWFRARKRTQRKVPGNGRQHKERSDVS